MVRAWVRAWVRTWVRAWVRAWVRVRVLRIGGGLQPDEAGGGPHEELDSRLGCGRHHRRQYRARVRPQAEESDARENV